VGLLNTRNAQARSLAAKRAQRPYRYALALVLACATLLALVLLFLDRSVPLHEKFTQIGTGLASSIIFALIYTVLANREYAELIRNEINAQLRDNMTELLNQMKQLNQLFLPTDQYPAAKEFDFKFNRDLTRDLCSSSFYFFRGTSARYVPVRLRQSDHSLDSVQVISVDPRDDGAIEARAADRRRRPGYEGKSLADIEGEIRDEILCATTALFDCKDVCNIDLGFVASTSPVRIEIFDNAIYTSLYRTPDSLRNTYPETARFGKDSQTYLIFRDECRRQLQLASLRKRFTARDGDAELLEYLSSLGYSHVDEAELVRVRGKYQTSMSSFVRELKTIGAVND
jgi:hypothetical protein